MQRYVDPQLFEMGLQAFGARIGLDFKPSAADSDRGDAKVGMSHPPLLNHSLALFYERIGPSTIRLRDVRDQSVFADLTVTDLTADSVSISTRNGPTEPFHRVEWWSWSR